MAYLMKEPQGNEMNITMDGRASTVDRQDLSTLAELVYALDYLLLKDERRISSITSDGSDYFDSASLNTHLDVLNKLEFVTAVIPHIAKRAVIHLQAEDVSSEIHELGESSFRMYAERTNADYVKISAENAVFQIANLLLQYDRLFILESGLLIKIDCPDLFILTPRDKVALCSSGTASDIIPGIFSRLHRSIFFENAVTVSGKSDLRQLVKTNLNHFGVPICVLPETFNSPDWQHSENAHIINYQNIEDENKLDLIKEAWPIFKEAKRSFKTAEYFLVNHPSGGDTLAPYVPQLTPLHYLIEDLESKESYPELTFLPMIINHGRKRNAVPIGDAVLSLPIVKELGLRIYLPQDFAGDLLCYLIEDDIKVTRKLTSATKVEAI